jgi:Rieske 2Fe-2S family protein
LKNAKIAHKKSFKIKANWKLAADNFFECYHCFANHPEMCEHFIHPNITSTVSPEQNMKFIKVWLAWKEAAELLGHPTDERTRLDPNAEQFNIIYRTPINTDAKSYGKDGAALAPLMGKYKNFDNGETFGYSGPLLQFSMPNDHAYMARLNPISIDEAEIELFWLVNHDAKEGVDYNVEDLTSLWSNIVKQDVQAIERAGKGSRSKYFQPGNYTELEQDSAGFAQWYRSKIANVMSNRII